MEVREIRPDEYDEAGRVTALAYREFVQPGEDAWEHYLAHIADVAGRAAGTTVFVAVDDGRVLGSATLELGERMDDDDPPLEPDEAHLRMLGVDPAARGRGVAKSLILACVDAARASGRTRMTLNTTHRMTAAQAMYEHLGFERRADRVFDDGFVLLTYERPIDPA
jgi:putative glutathione S-transferase